MYNSTANMEGEKREYQLQAVCFAAGTAVFIACLEQAIVRSFIEQWRVLMFLALNLLLLAILFTSTCKTSSKEDVQASNGGELFKAESKKRRKQYGPVEFADNEDGGDRLKHLKSRSTRDDESLIDDVEVKKEVIAETLLKSQDIDEADAKEQAFQLSKEELNERVEAFIAMFRQHLISDAKERNCRRLHSQSKKPETLKHVTTGSSG